MNGPLMSEATFRRFFAPHLKRLADLMERSTARAGEVVGRYGGEEFILVLPGASIHSALRTAERLKELVAAEGIPHEKSDIGGVITVSQGVVSVMPDADLTAEDIIKRADNALYQSKHSGRNTITVG